MEYGGIMSGGRETAVFGGGCFWCLEAVYLGLPGVQAVESGYAGGTDPSPTYEKVCSGRTGHAEVVRVTFDPATISFKDLLETFWKAHDPTTPNRQGADVGPQYRSIILCADEAQLREAELSKAQAQSAFNDPIVTEIAVLHVFHPAESYHHDFYRKNRDYPYCRHVIDPKLAKLGLSHPIS